jgi:bifunctional UDP-N-acetylglucosamine pyrophosphorylase/glucosamine-1-phosphate N-acetyltransferase
MPEALDPLFVILAAGQGTRMRSRTPKLLHPLCGRALIDWPLAAAREEGAGRIVVVDSPEGRLAEHLASLAEEGPPLEVAVQARALGTADALASARAQIAVAESVVVLAGDVPLVSARSLRELVSEHDRSGAAATMATTLLADPSGYGRVLRGADGTVERVVETKRPGDATPEELRIEEVNTGIFAFAAAVLLDALDAVEDRNAQRERYLPDVLPILRARGQAIGTVRLSDPREVLGVNDRRQLAEVRAIAQERIIERHLLAGVTVVDPHATLIDVGVEIEPDVTIEPFTCLQGSTRIAAGSRIGPHATLIDAEVGEQARIVHSHLDHARVGDHVSVGPFAYLRPGTILREGSRAGTFVELKNTDVGRGSKVPHLSYVGDATIGEDTNLGASTITANWDGYRKHPTRIGSRVRTSVDTTLVAPVQIGDDAYTGAGSVITDDVPAGALGIARERQSTIAGYAERRRERAATDQDPPQRPARP